jgi:hypothetical protein
VPTLSDEQLDALADALAERLAARLDDRRLAPDDGVRLVDAATLARALDVDRSYVYDHAAELGARRLPSDGKRGRLRFDVDAAKAAMVCSASRPSQPENAVTEPNPTPRAGRSRRSPKPTPEPGAVLRSRPRGVVS